MPTVLHRLGRWAQESPTDVAQRYRSGDSWKEITAGQFRDNVYHLALFLASRGFTAEQATSIYSYNCPAWVQLQLASLLLGGRAGGIYPNSSAKDIKFILNHAESSVLGIQDPTTLQKVLEACGGQLPPRIATTICFDGTTALPGTATSFSSAIQKGAELARSPGAKTYDELLRSIDPGKPAFMLYTSGTTGNSKCALLSHENMTFMPQAMIDLLQFPRGERGVALSFLPLCHMSETLMNLGIGLMLRFRVDYCKDIDAYTREIVEVQPTAVLCVPRLWEKMLEKTVSEINRLPAPVRHLQLSAIRITKEVHQARRVNSSISPMTSLYAAFCSRFILPAVRRRIGLSRARVLISGAAALAPHLYDQYRALGFEIFEGYGMTESTGLICITSPGMSSPGTVGRAVPGIEMKLADDGEILTRGPHVFLGYYKDPEATSRAMEGGWLHTGDLGELDAQQCLRIKGRKKEIIKTSGGKMIAPLPIEESIKSAPEISQVCVVGDNRKYVSALITISESARAELLAREASSSQDSVNDESIRRKVQSKLDQVNSELASFEQIKKFTLLRREFSVAGGELSPTMKMKRNVIEEKYKPLIDKMYDEQSSR